MYQLSEIQILMTIIDREMTDLEFSAAENVKDFNSCPKLDNRPYKNALIQFWIIEDGSRTLEGKIQIRNVHVWN